MSEDIFEIKVLSHAFEILNFEKSLLQLQDESKLDVPVYLGIGQEYVASALATLLKKYTPGIFAQHRSHSYFIAFGGNKESLLSEILGDRIKGCSNGYGGSVGIFSKDIPMFGHTGIMGEQAYLGAGWSFATKRPAIVVLGDATLEEDYLGPTLGFCSMHNVPVLFICEDNGLAVLTPTSKRRKWTAPDLAEAYGLECHDLEDDPFLIQEILNDYEFEKPIFLNIRVQRKNRHVGALLEGEIEWDREQIFKKQFISIHGNSLYEQIKSAQIAEEVSNASP